MAKVKLREAAQTGDNGATPGPSITLKPLRVSGIVVSKADLVQALRAAYVPGLVDITSTEDGEHFWLMLAEGGRDEDPAAR